MEDTESRDLLLTIYKAYETFEKKIDLLNYNFFKHRFDILNHLIEKSEPSVDLSFEDQKRILESIYISGDNVLDQVEILLTDLVSQDVMNLILEQQNSQKELLKVNRQETFSWLKFKERNRSKEFKKICENLEDNWMEIRGGKKTKANLEENLNRRQEIKQELSQILDQSEIDLSKSVKGQISSSEPTPIKSKSELEHLNSLNSLLDVWKGKILFNIKNFKELSDLTSLGLENSEKLKDQAVGYGDEIMEIRYQLEKYREEFLGVSRSIDSIKENYQKFLLEKLNIEIASKNCIKIGKEANQTNLDVLVEENQDLIAKVEGNVLKIFSADVKKNQNNFFKEFETKSKKKIKLVIAIKLMDMRIAVVTAESGAFVYNLKSKSDFKICDTNFVKGEIPLVAQNGKFVYIRLSTGEVAVYDLESEMNLGRPIRIEAEIDEMRAFGNELLLIRSNTSDLFLFNGFSLQKLKFDLKDESPIVIFF